MFLNVALKWGKDGAAVATAKVFHSQFQVFAGYLEKVRFNMETPLTSQPAPHRPVYELTANRVQNVFQIRKWQLCWFTVINFMLIGY